MDKTQFYMMDAQSSHCADASGRPQTDQGVHPSCRSLLTYNHIIMWPQFAGTLDCSFHWRQTPCFTKGFQTCFEELSILCNTFSWLFVSSFCIRGSLKEMRDIGATDPDERWWLKTSHKWLQALTKRLFQVGLLGNRPLSYSQLCKLVIVKPE